MRLMIPALVAVAALTVSAAGQTPVPIEKPAPGVKPGPTPKDEPIPIITPEEERRGEVRQKSARERFSTLVDVMLLHDEKMRGVVKNGLYVERPFGIGFKACNREDPRSGIRLWHVAGATSFAFIPYREIRSYRVVRTLTELQVRDFASDARSEAMRRAEIARAEAMRQRALRRLHEEDAEILEKLDDVAAMELADAARVEKELAFLDVLELFPPDEGWLPTRIVDIRRRVAVDLFPTVEEKGFIQAYDAWRPAYVWWNDAGRGRYESLERARVDLLLEESTSAVESVGEGGVVPRIVPKTEGGGETPETSGPKPSRRGSSGRGDTPQPNRRGSSGGRG